MWIGFSAVEGTVAGVPLAEAFSLESCQNWLPGEPHPSSAERCVRLGPAGQCNTDLCSAPHSYVCELQPGGALGPLPGGEPSCPGLMVPCVPQLSACCCRAEPSPDETKMEGAGGASGGSVPGQLVPHCTLAPARPSVGRGELPYGSARWGPAGAPEPPGAAGGPLSPAGGCGGRRPVAPRDAVGARVCPGGYVSGA